MIQPIHQYHYHYLYSYEKNTPLRLTDTQLVTDENTGVTIFHHHIYTILYQSSKHTQTARKGNIYQINNKEQQAIESLLGMNNVHCQIEKPTKPTKPVSSVLPPQTIQLISREKLLARQMSAIAQQVSTQAVNEIEKKLSNLNTILEKKPTLSLGQTVCDGQRQGMVVGTVRRPKRQLRWRVEWEDGTRESYYAHNLKPMLI